MKLKPLIALPFVLAALALAACADKTAEQHIASAKASLQKKEPATAVIELKSALEKNPFSGEARFLLGTTLLQQGKPQEAEVELRKAQQANHPADQFVPELAKAMLMMGQAKKVVDEFGQLQLNVPSADARLQTVLASAYGAMGKADQARTALAAALAADPQYAEALLISARQKAAGRDVDGALAVVEGIVSREPGNAEAWMFKGELLLYGKNQPDEALAAYRKALAGDPKFVAAHVAVFEMLMGQRKLDEAASQLEELKKFAARNPQTRFMEAQLAYYKKDSKTARELAQEVVREAPNSARVLELAGAIELQAGNPLEAVIYLARALRLAPERAQARRLLILSHLRSGQPAKALAELNAAAGNAGVPPALYRLAGEVYLQNGDAKKAEAYFAKALELDPDDVQKRTALAIARLAGGKDELAIGELQDIAASDSAATADLALISAHLSAGDRAKALAAIDKLEAKQPDKPLASNLRGRVLLAQKDHAGARKSFERALSIDPNYFAAVDSLAAMDLADKKPDDAKKRFEALLAKNPKNESALLALAQLAAAQGRSKDEVAALLDKAIDANPTSVAPRLLLVEHLISNRDYKQALSAAQNSVAAIPSSPELLEALGRAQQAAGDINQAIATFNKLAASRPLATQAHMRLAGAQVAAKYNEAGEQSLRKVLELRPDDLQAQRALVVLLLLEKRFPDALTVARQVQQQRPKEAAGFAIEGDIKVMQRDWSGAASAYRAGLLQVESAELAMKLHGALLASGKGAEAEALAASWIKSHPDDADSLAYLGEVAIQNSDYAAAEKHYALVLQLQPDNAVALNNMAWVRYKLRRDGAITYAEKANRLAPNQPTFMDTLATLMSGSGDHSKAIELQVKAVALQPGNALLRLNLAKLYIAAGDKARARTELAVLEKLGDKHPAYPDTVALLKTL